MCFPSLGLGGRSIRMCPAFVRPGMCVCVFVFCFISASDFAFFVLFLPRSFTINNTLLDTSSATRSLSRYCSWFQFSARASEKTGSCVSRFKYRSLCAHSVPVCSGLWWWCRALFHYRCSFSFLPLSLLRAMCAAIIRHNRSRESGL